MENTNIQQVVLDYLSKVIIESEQDRINICAWIYRKISTEDVDSVELFRFFLENADDVESDDSAKANEVFSEADVKEYRKKYATLTDAVFEKVLAENYSETHFYKKLWESINESVIFDTEKAKIFALYYIWIDVRIPYYQLGDGLSMTNQKFSEITTRIRGDIKKARFILKTNKFDQRTNRSSILLELIEKQSSFEERTVLLAHVISFLKPTISESILRDILHAKGIQEQEAK